MKYQTTARPVLALLLGTLFSITLTDCSDSPSRAKLSITNEGGAAGEAGAGNDAVQRNISVCGTPALNSQCDPLTGAPCDVAAGQTCDYEFASRSFICFDGPNSSKAGEICDDINFCGPSTTCNGDIAKCQHYCCSDSDCDMGSCLLVVFADGDAAAGACQDEFVEQGEAGAGG